MVGMFLKAIESLFRRSTKEIPVDSLDAWRLWMASESFPTLVAAVDLKVFDLLGKSPLTESEIRRRLSLSPRASKVLLWHLASLELLNHDSVTDKYALSSVARAQLLKGSTWRRRIAQMTATPVTPESYLRDISRNAVPKLRFSPSRDLPLQRIARARFALPAVIASVDLDLVQLLAERRVDLKTAPRTLSVPQRYLEEMLSYLQEYGMAGERNGKFGLTEKGKTYLLTDDTHPYHWGGLFCLMSSNPATPRSLIEAIRKEQTTAVTESSDAMMEHVMSASLAQVFAKHMHSQGAAAAVAVAQHPVFRSSSRVLDVAGGGGTYAFEIALHNPKLRVSVLELHPMVGITKQWIRFRGLGWRVSAITGNMFLASDWPKETFDTVFFSHVLHDWGPTKIKILLRNAFAALPSGGKIVLHEVLVGHAGAKRTLATAFSTTLYKWTEGRQYKAAELMHLLRAVGFQVTPQDIYPVHGPSSLIVARKPTIRITL